MTSAGFSANGTFTCRPKGGGGDEQNLLAHYPWSTASARSSLVGAFWSHVAASSTTVGRLRVLAPIHQKPYPGKCTHTNTRCTIIIYSPIFPCNIEFEAKLKEQVISKPYGAFVSLQGLIHGVFAVVLTVFVITNDTLAILGKLQEILFVWFMCRIFLNAISSERESLSLDHIHTFTRIMSFEERRFSVWVSPALSSLATTWCKWACVFAWP